MKVRLLTGISIIIIFALFIIGDPFDCFFSENLYDVEWKLSGDLGVHDPVVIKSDGLWHLFYTGVGLKTKYSEDALHWKDGKSLFNKLPDWYKQYVPYARKSIWAPDVFKYKNRYYLLYSLSSFGKNISVIGAAFNITLDVDDEDYEWKDLGPVVSSKETDNYNAIDPNVVLAKDGSIWLSFGSFWSGIKLLQLNPETFKPLDETKLYSLARRKISNAVEAPFIIYHKNFYFLFVSFDYCCRGVDSNYKIAVGRSKKITGPYFDRNAINLINGGGTIIKESTDRWKGPGHCAVYQSGQTSVLVYHAYDADNSGKAELRIEPLYWDDDNWPYL